MPTVKTSLGHTKNLAHLFHRIFVTKFFNEQISLAYFYFFWSFAKNQVHPLIFHLQALTLSFLSQVCEFVSLLFVCFSNTTMCNTAVRADWLLSLYIFFLTSSMPILQNLYCTSF